MEAYRARAAWTDSMSIGQDGAVESLRRVLLGRQFGELERRGWVKDFPVYGTPCGSKYLLA
jgi:hypothetical protein